MSADPVAASEALDAVGIEIGAVTRELDPEQPLPADLDHHPGPGGLIGWFACASELVELLVLQAEDHPGVHEVQVLPVIGGHLVVARLARRRAPPPPAPVQTPRPATRPTAPPATVAAPAGDARPAVGATWKDLDPLRLRAIGSDPTSVLLDAGAAVRRGRVVQPSVAAVIAFGVRPWVFVPGLVVLAAAGEQMQRFVGALPELLRDVGAWRSWRRDGALARAVLLAAILERSWDEDVETVPISLVGVEGGVSARVPVGAGNPTLRALLALHRPTLDAVDPSAASARHQRSVRDDELVLTLRRPMPAKRPYWSQADRVATLVEHLRAVGPSTTQELITALDWSRATVRAALAAALDTGEIETIAKARQAPGQRYRPVER
jgi:hypothetical protein